MPTLRLIKSEIDRLGIPEKTTYYNDPDLTGFWLRVTANGVRTWGVECRVGSGRRAPKRRHTLASYGKARKLISQAALGIDPGAEKAEQKRAITVSELIDLYEAEGCYVQRGKRQGQPMKPLVKQYTMARLRHHVVPLLGARKANSLSVADMERFFRSVEAGETASDTKAGLRRRVIVKGGEGAARKVFRDFSAVCSFAERRGVIQESPCPKANVQRVDGMKERFLSVEEVERLIAALEARVEAGANPKALQIVLLWLFTGARRNEIAGLTWSEVRLDQAQPEIELADTKTGKSWRPLTPEADQLLRSIVRKPGSDYVFPAERGDAFYQGTQSIWEAAVRAAGLEGVTPHTLRHTMGSHAASAGISLPLVGAILGHANPRST